MDPNQPTDQSQNPMPVVNQPVQTPPVPEPVIPAEPLAPPVPETPVSQPEMPTANENIGGGDQLPPIPGV